MLDYNVPLQNQTLLCLHQKIAALVSRQIQNVLRHQASTLNLHYRNKSGRCPKTPAKHYPPSAGAA
jgi:hypothetical protein